MNYAAIKPVTIENGTGVRTSLFVCGCRRHCKGCHNAESWDFKAGKGFEKEDFKRLMEYVAQPYVDGITILGGEPFEPENVIDSYFVARYVKEIIRKDVWAYSGYTFEELINYPTCKLLLKYCDVLVDGAYIESERDITLAFRGSRNQRIINVPESLKAGKVVLLELDRKETKR